MYVVELNDFGHTRIQSGSGSLFAVEISRRSLGWEVQLDLMVRLASFPFLWMWDLKVCKPGSRDDWPSDCGSILQEGYTSAKGGMSPAYDGSSVGGEEGTGRVAAQVRRAPRAMLTSERMLLGLPQAFPLVPYWIKLHGKF